MHAVCHCFYSWLMYQILNEDSQKQSGIRCEFLAVTKNELLYFIFLKVIALLTN